MNKNNTSSEQELQEFIVRAIEIVGSVAELAKIAGVSERTVYAWRNGERHPNRTNLNRVTAHLSALTDNSWSEQTAPRPQWQSVHEQMDTGWSAASSAKHEAPRPHAHSLDEFVFVDKAEAKPSAGGGSLETSSDSVASYAFRLDWVLRKTSDTSRLKLMEVAGRSMESTLHNGDLVLINEQDRTLVEDRIYVIRVQDEIYVKRFSRSPGQYLFLGDNRALDYQDIFINLNEDEQNWEVIGRVIWAGKEF